MIAGGLMNGFSADKKRLAAIISLSVALFISFAYLLYSLLSPHHRTAAQKRSLLFGNDPTMECGTPLNEHFDARILNGRRAVYGEFPWHAVLGMDPDIVRNHCGGTVIGNRWILTAAHCFVGFGKNADQVYAVLGATNLTLEQDSGDHVRVHIASIFFHPEYNNLTAENDIAILKTVEKIDLTGKDLPIGPVCLPDEFNQEYFGNALFSGFGAIDANNTPASVLMAADFPLVPNQVCQSFWGNQNDLAFTDKHLCAWLVGGSTTTLGGDSGGPLVKFDNYHATVIGICSYSGNPSDPSVFTKVSSYVDWIYDTIQMNR